MILCTICARGGSKGVPNKNIKLIRKKYSKKIRKRKKHLITIEIVSPGLYLKIDFLETLILAH